MNILSNNPYRLLGVYANSPTKERLANHNRMKAFLREGKAVSFPLDLPEYLPPINRTEALVSDAEAELKLPQNQMLYAQFWFIKLTSLDEVAFNHLTTGEISKAEEIWQKKESVSSLQNRMVCALMRGDYSRAMLCAEALYGNAQHLSEFVSAINSIGVDAASLPFTFLDTLCQEVEVKDLLPHITNKAWGKHIRDKAFQSLIDSLQTAIDEAEGSKGKGSLARLRAGELLMQEAQSLLEQLEKLVLAPDVIRREVKPRLLQYKMIADKLGITILECGIDYYNNSEEADAALKAMKLQKYALTIVFGEMAKERCQKNVDTLQEAIDNLPPSEVFAEDKAIREELRKYCSLPDKICHAVTLLNNTKPHLQVIKEKLGASNGYYLKISSRVVNNALSNIIEEVNEAQNTDEDIDSFLAQLLLVIAIESVLKEAWKATEIMDTFDMEPDFKSEIYLKNRSILKSLCEQLQVPTSTYKPKESKQGKLKDRELSKPIASEPSPSSSLAHSQESTTIPKEEPATDKEEAENRDGDSLGLLSTIAVSFVIIMGGFLIGELSGQKAWIYIGVISSLILWAIYIGWRINPDRISRIGGIFGDFLCKVFEGLFTFLYLLLYLVGVLLLCVVVYFFIIGIINIFD